MTEQNLHRAPRRLVAPPRPEPTTRTEQVLEAFAEQPVAPQVGARDLRAQSRQLNAPKPPISTHAVARKAPIPPVPGPGPLPEKPRFESLEQGTIAPPMSAEITEPLSEIVKMPSPNEIDKLFKDLVELDVSDVHMFRSGTDGSFKIYARRVGHVEYVGEYRNVAAKTVANLVKSGSKMTTDSNLLSEDGSYDMVIGGVTYRARAVALPLFDGGEKIVFRLPQTGSLRPLDKLGFVPENLDMLRELLEIPGGLTLVAGPTGEGKSTTALSITEYLRNSGQGVVMTLEDPVERILSSEIAQMEVREDVPGAGFSDAMRYVVRADPNVLFVGEIRDQATATAAVEIAKAGRRVIATIHANDNISAFLRIMGMADDTPLSVLDSITGVVSQRLIPRIGSDGVSLTGRYPIHEVTINTDDLSDALIANTSRASIKRAAYPTTTTFMQNIDALVEAGITTYEGAAQVVLVRREGTQEDE